MSSDRISICKEKLKEKAIGVCVAEVISTFPIPYIVEKVLTKEFANDVTLAREVLAKLVFKALEMCWTDDERVYDIIVVIYLLTVYYPGLLLDHDELAWCTGYLFGVPGGPVNVMRNAENYSHILQGYIYSLFTTTASAEEFIELLEESEISPSVEAQWVSRSLANPLCEVSQSSDYRERKEKILKYLQGKNGQD